MGKLYILPLVRILLRYVYERPVYTMTTVEIGRLFSLLCFKRVQRVWGWIYRSRSLCVCVLCLGKNQDESSISGLAMKLSFVHAVAAENTKEKVNFFRVFKVHGYILQVRWTKAKLLTSNWNFFGVFGAENYWQRFISDLVAQEGIGWRFLRLMVYLSNQWLEYVGRISGVTMGAVAPGRSRRGGAKQPR